MSVALDDIWLPGAHGVGSLLMTDPALPRDQYGHPHQPLFWFDEESRPLGMVVDGEGHILAWDADASEPVDIENIRCCRVPAEVEAAAWAWWEDQA